MNFGKDKRFSDYKYEGMLLYPTVNDSVNEELFLGEYKLRVKTLDLGQEWKHIHDDLLS